MESNQNTSFHFDNSYAHLSNIFYTKLLPTPVAEPKIVVFNEKLANSLELNAQALNSEEGASIFAGNIIPDGANPLAQAYAGHQFGHFRMLGDGRAILLGEHVTASGERYDIQLKGPGRTPYSRDGDGRAALGPMLREYIISEAMFALGIPTTRSLAVVSTGESIYREKELQGAILTRIAASHLRVATFQYAANWGTKDELRELADYAIARHYPFINSSNRYITFLEEVVKKQAALIAQWQLVGFIHGVMNTDNMTISGETIDYGPCAFMDEYNLETVFSSIDKQGRYKYGNQPPIGGWNLARLAESLLPLIHEAEEQAIELAQHVLEQYPSIYTNYWLAGMRAKLGIFNEEEADVALIDELLGLMTEAKADYTNTFVALTFNMFHEHPFKELPAFHEWKEKWQQRLKRQMQSDIEIQALMKRTNPAIIARNHRVEEALKAAEQGDLSVMKKLVAVLSRPFAHSDDQKEYAILPGKSTVPYRTFCGT